MAAYPLLKALGLCLIFPTWGGDLNREIYLIIKANHRDTCIQKAHDVIKSYPALKNHYWIQLAMNGTPTD